MAKNKTSRTMHWHYMLAYKNITKLYMKTFGQGLNKRRLTHEQQIASLKQYLKDQRKYVLANPRKARIN